MLCQNSTVVVWAAASPGTQRANTNAMTKICFPRNIKAPPKILLVLPFANDCVFPCTRVCKIIATLTPAQYKKPHSEEWGFRTKSASNFIFLELETNYVSCLRSTVAVDDIKADLVTFVKG